MTRTLGLIAYALLVALIAFYVGLRHGEIATGPDRDNRPRAVLSRTLVSWFMIAVGAGTVTLFFWTFLYTAPR